MAAGQREVKFKAAALKSCVTFSSDWVFEQPRNLTIHVETELNGPHHAWELETRQSKHPENIKAKLLHQKTKMLLSYNVGTKTDGAFTDLFFFI